MKKTLKNDPREDKDIQVIQNQQEGTSQPTEEEIDNLGRIEPQHGLKFVCESSLGRYYRKEKGESTDGIYFVKAGADLEQKERISDLIEVNYTYADQEGGNFGFLVSFKNRFGKETTANISASDSAVAKNKKLESLGFIKEERSQFKAGSLADFISMSAKNAPRALVSNITGWSKSEGGCYSYILPNKIIGSDGVKIVYDSKSEDLPYGASGTLEDWQQNISSLAHYSARICFAMSVCFGAPLLDIYGSGIHNQIFSFFGSSSQGKSTALRMATSVFGHYSSLPTWNATGNGLEGICQDSNDSTLVLDELGEANPQTVISSLYEIANGKGKARMNRDTTIRKRKEWRLFGLSTGECNTRELALQAKTKINAGQEVRLVNIPLAIESPFGIFDSLPKGFRSIREVLEVVEKNLELNHGIAYENYLEALVKLRNTEGNKLTEFLRQKVKEFEENNTCTSYTQQVKRVCRAFGLVAVGGALASGSFNNLLRVGNLTKWDEGKIVNWTKCDSYKSASECFSFWLDYFGNPEVTKEESELLDRFNQLLSEGHRFISLHEPSENQYFVGWKYLDFIYIDTEHYKTHIVRGARIKSVDKVLSEHGLLIKVGASVHPKSREERTTKTRQFKPNSE